MDVVPLVGAYYGTKFSSTLCHLTSVFNTLYHLTLLASCICFGADLESNISASSKAFSLRHVKPFWSQRLRSHCCENHCTRPPMHMCSHAMTCVQISVDLTSYRPNTGSYRQCQGRIKSIMYCMTQPRLLCPRLKQAERLMTGVRMKKCLWKQHCLRSLP